MRMSAVSAIKKKIARSTRRSPGAGVLLALTSTFNTVARFWLRLQEFSAHGRTVPPAAAWRRKLWTRGSRDSPSHTVWRTACKPRRGSAVIVERTENPMWLSNAYLVADEAGGKGVLIDGNDELGPLLERAERDGIEITHVLVTHPHGDHVAGLAAARQQLGGPPLVAHAETAAELEDEVAETLADGGRLSTGGLEIEAIYTPGPRRRPPRLPRQRLRPLHRRRALQGNGRRDDGARAPAASPISKPR